MNIFNLFKTHENTVNEKQEEIYKEVGFGDIIWAKMYLTEDEKNKLVESHQTRPYLILDKDEYGLYAFSSSTNIRKNYRLETYLNIDKDKYHIKKDSQICLDELYLIPKENIKSKFYKLDKEDLQQVAKKYTILKNKNIHSFDINLPSFNIDKKDIIKYHSKVSYLIINTDKDYYYGVFANKNKEGKTTINKNHYNVDFNRYITIPKSRKDEIELVDIADDESFQKIININKKRKNIYELGSVIKHNNTSYIIVYMTNDYLFCFNIDSTYDDINIIKVKKDENIKIENKKSTNLYNDIKQYLEKDKYIKIGTIIGYENNEYIVVGNSNNKLSIIKYDDIYSNKTIKEIDINNNYLKLKMLNEESIIDIFNWLNDKEIKNELSK